MGYGQEPIIERVNLEVATGKFVSLVGPSGSGKTSILRAVSGLLAPRSGSVELNGDSDALGFLFQDDGLLPWRAARANVALGMRIRKIPRGAALDEADAWLARLGLEVLVGVFRMNFRAGSETVSPSPGIFREEGLDVQIVLMNGRLVAPALLQGDLDYATLADTRRAMPRSKT